jgi:histone acetyltransferase (RNA polymerase elongator complex component)
LSKGRPKHLIVPIFIPNQGCPHRCIFCEQERITSQVGQSVDGKHVKTILDRSIRTKDFNRQPNPEVAFFGGTFTRLPTSRIRELLETVNPYIQKGLFRSIRVSTRPDALDEERLELMKSYGVLTVELGAQSMDNEVLSLSKRGHTAGDTINAVQILREKGFRVGIQLMPGLPGDSEKKIHSTITEVIKLHPDMVRLYPTLVIQGTELARWYSEGRYRPMPLDGAVSVCIESCIRLEAKDIPVIRIGLMSSPSLLEKGQIVAGPWHPAFGFLVRSGIHQKGIEQDLPRLGEASKIKIRAPKREIPLLRGYKNLGLEWIERKTGARINGIETDDSILPGRVIIEKL